MAGLRVAFGNSACKSDEYFLWFIHTAETRTATGNGMGTIETNDFIYLSLSLSSVYSTQRNIETHHLPVPVPVPVQCSVNEPFFAKKGSASV